MSRGQIYWINLGSAIPPEFGKTRPALVVSNSEQNQILDSIVVVPVSSRPGEIWPLRVEIVSDKTTTGLPKKSFAVIPGIRQIAKSRLEKLYGVVNDISLDKVTQAIVSYLSD